MNTLLDTTHPSGQQPLKWLIGRVAIREHSKHCTYCVSSTLTPMPTHTNTNTHMLRGGEKNKERERERKSRHTAWSREASH